MKKVLIHIGYPKSASSSLQHYFSELKEKNIKYFDINKNIKHKNNLKNILQLNNKKYKSIEHSLLKYYKTKSSKYKMTSLAKTYDPQAFEKKNCRTVGI